MKNYILTILVFIWLIISCEKKIDEEVSKGPDYLHTEVQNILEYGDKELENRLASLRSKVGNNLKEVYLS